MHGLLNLIEHFLFIDFDWSFSSCDFFPVFQGPIGVKIVSCFLLLTFNYILVVFRSRRFW